MTALTVSVNAGSSVNSACEGSSWTSLDVEANKRPKSWRTRHRIIAAEGLSTTKGPLVKALIYRIPSQCP